MKVYRYIIQRKDMTDEDVLQQVSKGHGFYCAEAAEEALQGTLDAAKVDMLWAEDTSQHYLYEESKKRYDKYKDSKVIKVEVNLKILEGK